MKKLIRNPEKFDVLELFASMAAEQGYDLRDPVAQDDFVARVRISIEKSKNNNIHSHGQAFRGNYKWEPARCRTNGADNWTSAR